MRLWITNDGLNNKRLNESTGKTFDIFKENKKDKLNEFGNRIPPPITPQHHYLRNALFGAGLAGGLGAMYRYRQPLLKLGQRVINYGLDKFHNLFGSTNSTNSTNSTELPPNPHNW